MKLARIAAAGVIALTIALAPHPAAAGTAEAGAMAAVNQFIAAFNSGDQKAIVDACTAQAAIIDDFPPHLRRAT